jgi:hypothetical protein
VLCQVGDREVPRPVTNRETERADEHHVTGRRAVLTPQTQPTAFRTLVSTSAWSYLAAANVAPEQRLSASSMGSAPQGCQCDDLYAMTADSSRRRQEGEENALVNPLNAHPSSYGLKRGAVHVPVLRPPMLMHYCKWSQPIWTSL